MKNIVKFLLTCSFILIFEKANSSNLNAIKLITPTVMTNSESMLGRFDETTYVLKHNDSPELKHVLNEIHSLVFNSTNVKSLKKSLRKRSTDSSHCESPDQEYLEGLLSEYQIHYRKFEETILKSKLDPTQHQSVTTSSNSFSSETSNTNNRLIDQSQCNPDDRNMTNLNQQSLCPWRYIISVRMDRYPSYRTEVKCTCDSCTTKDRKALSKNIYGCVPVLRPQPVLLRSECGPDGYYEWKPSLDEVNVACVCAFNHKYLPHI